jgi:tRNA pseudouridine13 synthase
MLCLCRYSDFLVNEIGLDGQVVHLTDVSRPACDEQGDSKTSDEFASVLTEEQREELSQLSKGKDAEASVSIKVPDDKRQRGLIHKAIRSLFSNLDSLTEEDSTGSKIIKVVVADRGNCKGLYRNHPLFF